MLLTVLIATAKSLYAIDADVKTDLLARYPNMNTLSDAQLQKVVDLLNRFPGLKNLNQKDIDSIKERIEERRLSGNQVLGSGQVIKKLIEVNPDLLANIDPDRFRMRLSRSANGSLSIKEDLTAQFENMSKDEMKERWSQMPIMDKIDVLKAFREKVQEIRADGDWETNRELLVNYVYENKLTPDEQKRYEEKYYPKPNEGEILKDLTGDDGKREQNWTMFWMLPPETRREVYRSWGPGDAHFDDFANPDSHKDRDTSDKYDGFDNLFVEGIQGTHINCKHDKNKFWNAFAEQYPRAWEGWFKENIWNQDLVGVPIPIPDPSNFPSDKLKDRLKDWITAKWPPLPPELPSKEEIKEIIQKAYCSNNPGSRACQVDRPESILSQLQGKINAFCVNNPSAKACQEVGFDPTLGIITDEVPGRPESILSQLQGKINAFCVNNPSAKACQEVGFDPTLGIITDEVPGRPESILSQLQGKINAFCVNNPSAKACQEVGFDPTDRDKLENLIGFLQGQEKPGWDPIPPEMKPEMDDIIAILQNYQRVETPNAEELLRRSKKTSGGS